MTLSRTRSPGGDGEEKSPCHGPCVPRYVAAGSQLGDLWAYGVRVAVVVILVVVVVVGMRAIDRQDHGDSDESP